MHFRFAFINRGKPKLQKVIVLGSSCAILLRTISGNSRLLVCSLSSLPLGILPFLLFWCISKDLSPAEADLLKLTGKCFSVLLLLLSRGRFTFSTDQFFVMNFTTWIENSLIGGVIVIVLANHNPLEYLSYDVSSNEKITCILGCTFCP